MKLLRKAGKYLKKGFWEVPCGSSTELGRFTGPGPAIKRF